MLESLEDIIKLYISDSVKFTGDRIFHYNFQEEFIEEAIWVYFQ